MGAVEMRSRFPCLALVVLSAGVAATAQAAQTGQNAGEWKRFSSVEDGFSVSFPGTPVRTADKGSRHYDVATDRWSFGAYTHELSARAVGLGVDPQKVQSVLRDPQRV